MQVNQNSRDTYRGHVVLVNSGAGYGFILAEDRNLESDVYFHTSDVVGGALNKNDSVTFRLTKTPKGYRARLIEREQRKGATQ